ncbi:hypothetical protein [Streptomyces olivaceoviridis]|uniref:hypothetical protein n=1 Tax=Streptomyces olivaceoviridis TaxID=1921 RepID=UPI00378F5A0F
MRFAGGSTWEKTPCLPEPSAHEDDLCMLAYQLIDAAGLQRARLTGIVRKGEDLIDVGQVAEQVSLDAGRGSRWSPSRPWTAFRDLRLAGCSTRTPRPRRTRWCTLMRRRCEVSTRSQRWWWRRSRCRWR